VHPSRGHLFKRRDSVLGLVISSAEVFFQPAVEETNKYRLPISFILSLELPDRRFLQVMGMVVRSFQGKLNREAKMRPKKRAASLDNCSTICLEGVGEVVKGNAK